MKWFEHVALGGAQRAKFADVTPGQRNVPSWVPGRAERRHESMSLRPPKLPSEFVDAVRQELDPDYAARARNSLSVEALAPRSELPLGSTPPGSAALHARPERDIDAAGAVHSAGPDPAVMLAFEQALQLLSTERERLLTETAGQVAQLAALIARRVIARELSLDPMLVQRLVLEGIEALGQHERVLVRLGSAFAPIRDALEQKLRLDTERIELRIDSSLSDWGCVVDTELGLVDESVESRLETLLQALKPGSSAP